jgi:chromosomal replication initiator protein
MEAPSIRVHSTLDSGSQGLTGAPGDGAADFGAICGLAPARGARPGYTCVFVPDATVATWSAIQAELRAAVTDSTYHLWLSPLRLEAIDGRRVLVGAPDAMLSWVAGRFAGVLEGCVAKVVGPGVEVAVVPLGTGAAERDPARTAPSAPKRHEPTAVAETFNPKYTFEQFVIGDANHLAHAAALAVAELPGQAYNPLFIYGPPGLGKTHLLHAIANYLAVNEPSARVRYTTAEAFTNHFVHALQGRRLESFKSLYREADVLLIDDVQFLESKARTEEEFFHTFNALYETGAQLVVTSDRLPRDLGALEDRLRERFESGLVTDVRPPDPATRLTILRKRVQHDGVAVAEPDAIERIAERIDDNVRALEGALIRIVAFHSLTRRPIDVALVDQVLQGLYPDRRPPRRSVGEIQQAICTNFEITLDELCSPSRVARLAWPRHVAMYVVRELTDASLPAIGREFGGRNHATVLNACRRTSERMATDPEALRTVEGLLRRLREA